jgi:L-fuconolactonase
MIVDSHQHFWNFNRMSYTWPTEQEQDLFRNIEPPELEPLLKQAGINQTIIVQAKDSCEETDYLLELAEEYDWIAGVVGWVPLLEADEAGKLLEKYTKNPYFKGVRHLIHEEKDPDWIVQERVIEGLKVLASYDIPYDFVAIFPNHLHHVPTLANKIPALKIVIDHLAKPPIKEKRMIDWAAQIKEAASYPQVFSKVSGLNTAADPLNWAAVDLQPYIDYAFEVFGADRLMFGSDWPVANLAGDYLKVWNETNIALKGRTKEEIDAVLGKTAVQFYKL